MPKDADVTPEINAADVLVGKEALEQLKDDVAAVNLDGRRVPRADRSVMVRIILAQLAALEGQEAGILDELSAARGRKFKAALKRLPTVCRALLHAQLRHRAAQASTDDAAQERDIEIVQRGREQSLKLLRQLEELGHVDPRLSAHIRSGKGYVDAAQDAAEMSNLFDEHWDVVEALQLLQSDESKRLTRAWLAEQQRAAHSYLEAQDREDGHLPVEERRRTWANTLMALDALLESDWDEVRHDAAFAFTHQRRPAEALKDLVSVSGLLLRR